MRASLACVRFVSREFPVLPRPTWLTARAPLAGALLGLAGAVFPVIGHAAITLELAQGATINVQANERIKVRNDATLADFARSDRPPLRVTAALYNGQNLPISEDLCVTMPNFDAGVEFGQTLTLRFADDSGAAATLALVAEQGGGGGNEAECRDPAAPVQQPSYPFTTQVAEDGNVLLPTASLLAVARDPNGGAVSWNNPGVQPSTAGTVQIEGTPGAPGGIRFTPTANFNGTIGVTYEVDDPDGDGPVSFAASVTVLPQNDLPTATDSNCSVGSAGGPCLLDFADIDTANLSFSIVTPPQGGALGTVNLATRQIVYTPRPGITTDSFTYNVADGSGGASAVVSITVTDAAQAPTAAIRLTRTDGTPISTPSNIPETDGAPGEAVRLDGTSSLPGTPSSPIVAYRWTVNNQALPQQTATVDVRLPDGQSTILLVVDDQLQRSSAAATQQATVAARPNAPGAAVISLNGAPVTGGAVTVDNEDFAPGETVTFDASQSSDPDQDPIVLYTWRLNGQQVQSSSSPTATLALNDGSNTVELTITDSRGGTGTVTITANVFADQDLGALPGLTGNERSIGRAISELCPRMNELPASSLTTGQTALLNRCTRILDDDDSGAQTRAVQALTPEEITSQQTTGIDFSTSQLGNLTSRLVALRQGAGGGLSTAGLSLRDAQGRPIPVEQLAALGRHIAGGASGDEDDASLAARWGIFVNGNVIDGEKDETANEAGFDFGGWGITAGFDYRLTDSFVLGFSLGYNEADSDFAGNSGSMDSEGMSKSIYGTYFNDRWYTDFIGSSGALDYESVRNIAYTDSNGPVQAVASGTTGGDLSTLGVSFGYDFNKGGWTFGPTAALTSVEVKVDAFAESISNGAAGLNMAFGNQRAQSRTAQGGFQFGYAVSREWGILSPQMRLSFVRELENDSELVNVRFVNDPFANNPSQPSPGAITLLTDDPDQNYLRWAAGVSFVRTNGFSAFVDYEALAGMSTVSSGELTFGLRFERNFE